MRSTLSLRSFPNVASRLEGKKRKQKKRKGKKKKGGGGGPIIVRNWANSSWKAELKNVNNIDRLLGETEAGVGGGGGVEAENIVISVTEPSKRLFG